MNQCLVTQLKGVVNDSSLMRLGELRIGVSKIASPTNRTQSMQFTFTKETKIEIVGDGYFTDSTLANNLGKSMTIPAQSNTSVYFSNGDYEIAILDKYSLKTIAPYFVGAVSILASEMPNKSFSIDDFRYLTSLTSISLYGTQVSGDISALQNLTSLTYINLGVTQVSGDISALQNLTSLTYINLYGTQVSGDISALQNLTSLTYINLGFTQVSGDISALQNLTSLTYINLYGTQGSLSSLAGMTNLAYCSLKNSKITGDLAGLASKCYFASFQGDAGSVLTWTSRMSTSNIIAIEGNASMSNIDKMLQDQAKCVKAVPTSGESYYKVISLSGTRTSASDDAVAKLQQMGYTIAITKA